jgi:hypothetical protein
LWIDCSGCGAGITRSGKRHEVFPSKAMPLSENDGLQNSEALNFKALNYTELIPIMIKALQEQQQEIEELKRIVESRK